MIILVSSCIFYQNYLNHINQLSTIAVTGGAVGQSAAEVSTIQTTRQGASSATLQVSGTYTSVVERHYRVQIHVPGTGAFGSAQWRWSDTGGVTWNASNLTTVNGGAFISLSHGMTMRFLGGPTTPQFVNGDTWDFRLVLEYGPAKAADLSRETEYRSGTVPSNSSIDWRLDLGSALAPTVFALLDENMPANGTVTLRGNATPFPDATPDYTNVIASGTEGRRMELITPPALRYWSLLFTFVSVPALGYLHVSEIFLGAVQTFARQFRREGFRDSQRVLGTQDLETLVRGPSPFQLEGRYLVFRYGAVKAGDRAILDALRAWIRDRTVRTRRPIYFLPRDDQPQDFGLFHWVNDFELEPRTAETFEVSLELAEVIRTFDD